MDDAILSGLYGLRETPPGWPEIIAAIALGLLIAGFVGWIASMFRNPVRRWDIANKLAPLEILSEQDRGLALAGMLKELTDRKATGSAPWPERAATAFSLDPEIVGQLSNLYHPSQVLDSAALERAVLKAGRH